MLKMVDGTGIIGVDMVCPLGGTVSPPQPPNYDKVEVEGVGSLMLPNSLKAPLERLELLGNSVQNQYVLVKEAGTTSIFNFGVKWNEVNKIVLVADSIAKSQHIFFATFDRELIGIYPDMSVKFAGLTNGQCNLTSEQIIDGNKHEIIFTFDRPISDREITNIWDASWSKKIRYYRIGFYSDDVLIANFIPESENKMFDTVSKTYISASIKDGVYKLEQADGDPAPDNPQEIKSAGKYDEASGKYLLDAMITGKNLLTNKSADWQIGKGLSWSTYPNDPIIIYRVINGAVNVINLKPSTIYSIVNNSEEIVISRIIERNSSENGIKDHTVRSSKYTFVTNQNTMNAILQLKKVDGTELLSTDIESIKIMFVEGDIGEQTPYEPYTEQTVQIALDEPLRGIGDYKDVLTKDGVVRKIKRVVLDGSEDEEWRLDRKLGKHINFALVIKGAITVNTGIRTMMDKFKYLRAVWNNNLPGQDMFGAKLRINMPKTLATDLQTFKTWLSQNPLTVDYVLAEPVTEPLPESVQAQLSSLHSENGVTHVFVDSGEVEAGIKLTYRKEK